MVIPIGIYSVKEMLLWRLFTWVYNNNVADLVIKFFEKLSLVNNSLKKILCLQTKLVIGETFHSYVWIGMTLFLKIFP